MINRELIRIKVVQLVYAFYQNEGRTIDVAEKELAFSLGKAYDLYHHLLLLLVELRQMAENDRAFDCSLDMAVGYGIDALSAEEREADFRAVRGL